MTGHSDSQEVQRQPEQTPAAEPESGSAVIYAGERRVSFVGPLPPPKILADYEEVCSGAAERIITMAERQSAHRQSLEAAVVSANCDSQRRGPIFGFILASMVIIIGGILLWNGRDVEGLTALIAALASIVVPFLLSKRRQQTELREHRPQDAESDASEAEPS